MKTCKKCGVEKPKTEFSKHRTECEACVKEYNRAYRADRLDELRAVSREYHAAHRGVQIAKQKVYYRDNKEKLSAAMREYYESNLDACRTRMEKYRLENKEKLAEKNREYGMKNRAASTARVAKWYKDNPNAKRIASHNRRQRMKGKLSKGIADSLYAAQNGLCACCGAELGSKYHVDHIMPLSLGGANTDDNVQLLTTTCNLRKHAKHPAVYAQECKNRIINALV